MVRIEEGLLGSVMINRVFSFALESLFLILCIVFSI